MTIALSHIARDESLSPPLTGVYLNATSIVQENAVPDRYRELYRSGKQNDGKAGLSQKTRAMFVEAVAPDTDSELWNLLDWRNGHRDLPRTYFQVCGADIQRDDALVYERVLRLENGIDTRVDVYPGLPHVFWYLYPGHSACDRFYRERLEGFAWLLGK